MTDKSFKNEIVFKVPGPQVLLTDAEQMLTEEQSEEHDVNGGST